MTRLIITLFPVWAIGLSIIAYFFPNWFTNLKPAIIPLLSLIMFGMGMTLTWRHFTAVIKKPFIIALGVGIQFIFMPFVAWLLALVLELPEQLLVGMVLVGSTAGGTASNVICYLAKGDVALSILMTMTSTLCAVFAMPALTFLYLHQSVPVPVWEMMQSIMTIVLIPVVTGTAINSLYGKHVAKVRDFFPLLSSLAIVLIISIIVALNKQNLSELQLPLLVAVILHNTLGLLSGYVIPRLLNYDPAICRTVSIEVGMQNSGLSVALAIKYFSTLAALPGALFSIWHNVSGSMLAAYWQCHVDVQKRHHNAT